MDVPVKSFISQLSVNFCKLLVLPGGAPEEDFRKLRVLNSCILLVCGTKCCLAQSSLICLFIIRARLICVAVNLTPMPPNTARGGGGIRGEVSSSCKICNEHG